MVIVTRKPGALPPPRNAGQHLAKLLQRVVAMAVRASPAPARCRLGSSTIRRSGARYNPRSRPDSSIFLLMRPAGRRAQPTAAHRCPAGWRAHCPATRRVFFLSSLSVHTPHCSLFCVYAENYSANSRKILISKSIQTVPSILCTSSGNSRGAITDRPSSCYPGGLWQAAVAGAKIHPDQNQNAQ